MQVFPHHYKVAASAEAEGDVKLAADGLDTIHSAPPPEFGGPGDRWSPEMLLVAAVADCFILTFRIIASASGLSWVSLTCEVEGRLERSQDTIRFTQFEINTSLDVPREMNEEHARRVLEKTEASCLVTNSLSGVSHFNAAVSVQV